MDIANYLTEEFGFLRSFELEEKNALFAFSETHSYRYDIEEKTLDIMDDDMGTQTIDVETLNDIVHYIDDIVLF